MRKMLLWLISAALALQTAVEYLALPALFVVIGMLNGFGWKYYVWTIGGYAVIVILIEAIGGLVGKRACKGIASWFSKVLKSTEHSDSDTVC